MRLFLETIASRLTFACALIGMLGILAMLVHITSDVVFRQLFNHPIPATIEIVSRYYMVMIAFLPLGWSELRGDMITVDILKGVFTGVAGKLNALFVSLLTVTAYLILTYTTWVAANGELASGSYVIALNTRVPTWPSYFIMPLGFAVASATVLLRGYLAVTARSAPVSDGSPHEH